MPPDPIDRYLDSLRRRLTRRLPQPLVNEHIQEIAMHLRADAQNRIGVADAEVAAVRSFGSDTLVADSLIRAHSGIAKRSAWRLGGFSALLLLVAGALPFTFLFGHQDQRLMDIAMWLPWCFMVWFAIACFRTRRIVLTPVLAALGIVFALTAGQPWYYGPYGKLPSVSARRAVTVGQARQIIEVLSAELAMTTADSKLPFPDVLRSGKMFLAPQVYTAGAYSRSIVDPIGTSGTYTGVSLIQQDSEAEARSMWRRLGSKQVSSIRSDLNLTQTNMATWQKINPDWPTAIHELGVLVVLYLPIVAVIAAINLLALLAAEIRRRLVIAAWSRKRWA